MEDADYLFYSSFGQNHLNASIDCIKIFYTGENLCPDFNLCDYAIAFEDVSFGDRYLQLSNAYMSKNREHIHILAESKHMRALPPKTDFCSFVPPNNKGSNLRYQLFEELSRYKQVSSGGRWMNNVGGPVPDKIKFESKHKFSICFENTSHKGYTTEKIYEAFAAQTIPIYWGDPDITKTFNPRSFINVFNYGSLEKVIERVIEIDTNDDLYHSIMLEPMLINQSVTYKQRYQALYDFLDVIFSQPKNEAQRYNREYYCKEYGEKLRSLYAFYSKPIKDILYIRFKKQRCTKFTQE